MKVNEKIKCTGFSCVDIDKNSYIVPPVEIAVQKIKIMMITEDIREAINSLKH